METTTVQRRRVNVVILLMACIALALNITDNASGSPQTGGSPLTLSATSLSFGNVGEKDPTGSKTITLSNHEAVALNIAISLSNPDYTETDTCKGSVAAGGNCTISVKLTPSALGPDNSTLSVTDTALSISLTATLTATSVLPAILSSTSLNFGNVAENSPSTSYKITFYNTEAVPLNISISLSNPDYTETDTCKGSVAAMSNCLISVTFTPSVMGPDNGTLSVTDTAWNNPQTTTLTGTGALPLSLSATSLSFGNWGENNPTGYKNITLSNYESVALNISIGLSNRDYSETDTCKGSVAARGSCTISVELTPSVLGADNGTLSVTDTASNSPQTATLTATGVLPVTLSATSLSFSNVGENSPTGSKNITLYNNEGVALNISIALSNPDYTETDTCKGSVAARGYCTISVALTPSVLGADNGTLSVTDTASNSPQTATLTGAGVPQATVAATSLTFAAQSVQTTSGAKNVTLINNLSTPLTIGAITFTGPSPADFAALTNACGGSVAAKSQCTIPVTFTPGAPGIRTATLNVNDSANNSPQTVSLSGKGTAPVAPLSPTSLVFGNQPIDMTSSAQTVTLTNTGNAALSITGLALTGANSRDFAQANTCGSSVAAGGNCTIVVVFTPSVTGTESALLGLEGNGSGSPQTVTLSGTGTHDVILSWKASTTSGVVGYSVYRGATSGGESATPLNSSPINGTAYTDQTVQAGQTYYYVVTAVGSDDITHSANSNEVSAIVPSS